jgi:ubiquinone/menaquinone biosynthesis C-methylase UbiE
MVLSKEKVVELYRKQAEHNRFHNFLQTLYGFREAVYRERAVAALELHNGSVVVDIGCGKGENLALLEEIVGPMGTIIGVDLTDRVLKDARKLVMAQGWKNVVLIESDAATFVFPSHVDGILSTFALTLVPEFDDVIRRGSESLVEGGQIAVLDFRMPVGWQSHLAPLGAILTAPIGVSEDLAARHPWESVARHLQGFRVEEYYGGFVYLAVGCRKTDALAGYEAA